MASLDRKWRLWPLPQVREHGDVALEPQAEALAAPYRSGRVSPSHKGQRLH